MLFSNGLKRLLKTEYKVCFDCRIIVVLIFVIKSTQRICEPACFLCAFLTAVMCFVILLYDVKKKDCPFINIHALRLLVNFFAKKSQDIKKTIEK